MAKIIVEREKCIGCGTCAAVCGRFFEMLDTGKAHVKESKKKGENEELEIEQVGCAKEAVEQCPVECIKTT